MALLALSRVDEKQMAPVEAILEREKEQYLSSGDLTLCVACLEELANIIFIPCQHRVVCEKCVSMLEDQQCPCCRAKILFFNLVLVKPKGVEDSIVGFEDIGECALGKAHSLSPLGEEKSKDFCSYDCMGSASSVAFRVSSEIETEEPVVICRYCQGFHTSTALSKNLMYPLEKLIQQRLEHENSIIKKTLQVWVCGSSVEYNQLFIDKLRKQYPCNKGHDVLSKKTSGWKKGKEAAVSFGNSLKRLPYLEILKTEGNSAMNSTAENCPIFNHLEPPVNLCFRCMNYTPNVSFGGTLLCFNNVRIWELLRFAKSEKTVSGPDVLLFCCYTDSEQSLYDILGLHKRLRDRYGFSCREVFVLLNGKSDHSESERNGILEQESSSLSLLTAERVLKGYDLDTSVRKVGEVFSISLTKQSDSYSDLLKRLSREAKIQRKYSNRLGSSERNVVHRNSRNNPSRTASVNRCHCM